MTTWPARVVKMKNNDQIRNPWPQKHIFWHIGSQHQAFFVEIDFQWSWPHDPWPYSLSKWSKWKKTSKFGILDPKNIYFDILEAYISVFLRRTGFKWSLTTKSFCDGHKKAVKEDLTNGNGQHVPMLANWSIFWCIWWVQCARRQNKWWKKSLKFMTA